MSIIGHIADAGFPPAWTAPPAAALPAAAAPPLTPGVVDLWRADLDAVAQEPAALLSSLEEARLERFGDGLQGERWARGRRLLRALLGSYLDADPAALSLSEGPHGKPELSGGPERVSFNMSHSGPLALYAFTVGSPVGVDLELLDLRKPGFDVLALALRVFGPLEVRRLQDLDQDRRRREFLRLWVRHEAALKCRGTGLLARASSDRDRPVGVRQENNPATVRQENNPATVRQNRAEAGLWLTEIPVGPQALAALASAGDPQELRLWERPTPG